jgi:hypothetical protein
LGGYSATGYADYTNPSGDYVEWTVSVPTAGTRTLGFHYALNGDPRALRIAVNGTTVRSSLAFPATGSFAAWQRLSITATLTAGQNTVRATAIGSSGPNVDYLAVR